MVKNAEKLISTKELSKISKAKIKTIARYVRQGLLIYSKQDDNFNRYYNKNKVLKRLKEIRRLKNEGLTLLEMKGYLHKKAYGETEGESERLNIKRKPSVIFKNSQTIKKQLEKRIWKIEKTGVGIIAIIRDLARKDSYPESGYSKVEIKGLYHKGLEVFIYGSKQVVFDKKKKEWRSARKKEKNTILALRVGRILFDNIIEIDWDGDEYYPYPHIYCNFKGNDCPYEKILFYQEIKEDYQEIKEGYQEIREGYRKNKEDAASYYAEIVGFLP